MAAFALAAGGYMSYLVFGSVSAETFSSGSSVWLIALFWPQILFICGVGGALIGLTTRDWNGNVQRMLLLRLLDEQQKKDG
jgi:hypothetical protein